MPESDIAHSIGSEDDEKAWDPQFIELYRKEAQPLERYLARAFRVEATAAADIVQDAFLVLYQVGPKEQPKSYLYKVATHLVYRMWRQQGRERELKAAERPSEPVPGDDLADALVVESAFAALAPRQRQAAVLRYTYQFSLQEIAEIMGIAVGTVKALVWQAGERLRRTLSDTFRGDES